MNETAEPAPQRRGYGCQIAAILSLVVLVVLIAVPGFLASGRASNHRNAAAGLKTLSSAEADFRSNDRDDNQVNDFWVGDVSRLYYLEVKGQPIKLVEISVADADASPKGTVHSAGPKVGFRYAAIPNDEGGAPYDRGGGRNPEKYGFCAYPEAYKTKAWYRSSNDLAQFTFIINQDAILWKKDVGGAPAVKWPKDPLAEGWTRLD